MTTKLFLAKYRWVTLCIVILAFGILGILIWRGAHHPLAQVDFQEYAPTNFPPSIQITSENIQTWVNQKSLPSPSELDIMLTNYDEINEMKNDGRILVHFTYNCPASSNGSKCSLETTPRGQRYVMSINYMYKRTFLVVTWLHGGTLIKCLLMGNQTWAPPYTTVQLGSFIDSFVPVQYEKLPVKNL